MKILKTSAIILGVLASLIVLFLAFVYMLLEEPKDGKYSANKNGLVRLEHSITINTTPDRIWEFFTNIDRTYTVWYPTQHVLWKWTKGRPFEIGSIFYSEQYMLGELGKLRGVIVESVPNKKITIALSFPASIISPKLEWILSDDGKATVFTAVTYVRSFKLFRLLFRDQLEKSIEGMEKHVVVEGENLKRILEKGTSGRIH